MSPREEMEAVLKKLGEEYRFWMVEALKMERGIELMEEEIQSHDEELGVDRAADLRRRLSHVRDNYYQIEERILAVRKRLEELHERLSDMPN